MTNHVQSKTSLLQIISEEGFLDKLKSMGRSKPLPSALKEAEAATVRPDTTTAGESQLARIASEAVETASGETRFVIYLTNKDLTSHYLKFGGGASLIDVMTDEEVELFSRNPAVPSTRIVKLPKKFTFLNITAVPNNKYAQGASTVVIIDVPDSTASKLSANNSIAQTREILKDMMDHQKYYVMTLYISRAKKIESTIYKAVLSSDIDELKNAFDPNIIANYPYKQIKIAAIDEWDELKSSAAPTEKETDKEKESEKEKEAEPEKETKLNRPEMLNKMMGLWNDWKATGLKADPSMKQFIKTMWNDSK